MHCGFGIVPARPYKPRDKAKVENAVQVAQRWIVAALRHHKFFSLEELNVAIRELLAKLNHRPFRKREGSRASVFEAIDQAGIEAAAHRAIRSERVVARSCQHRLPRGVRFQSVQRALQPGTRTDRDPLHAHHGRDLAQRLARGVPPAQSRKRADGDQCRAPPQEPSRASGMDALAHGPLGANHWPPHGAIVRADHERQAASGDGISRLPGHHPAGRRSTRRNAWKRLPSARLLTGACRYKSVESILKNSLDRVPLSSATARFHAAARQHPRLGVLRVGRPACYRNR